MDSTSEQETAGPRPDTTLQKCPDVAFAGEATVASEQGVLLTENPGGANLDHCCL